MGIIEWLLFIVPVPIWVIILYFVFIGVFTIFMVILEWKYFGLKYEELKKRDNLPINLIKGDKGS